ncbi:MAG: response regulator [Polyangiaceae bacterium]|nr:response regulator [Polyangiaceae bacterium]
MSSSKPLRLASVPSLSWDDCRLLVESVVDYAIFMLDVEGRVATWNIGAEKIKGYRASEILGQHFSKFYPEEDVIAGKPLRELEVATAVGRIEDEGWRVRKDGSRFWANVVITALRDDRGNLRGFGKVTRDLTARHAAEDQMRAARLAAEETERKLLREQWARETAEESGRRLRESEERYRILSERLQAVLDQVARQERQARYLGDATGALATTLEQDEMLQRLANVVVPELADWCSVLLFQGDKVRNVAVAHRDPARLALAREYQERYPVTRERSRSLDQLLETGEAVLIPEITDKVLVEAAPEADRLEMLRSMGLKSAILAPIRIRTRIVGAISLVFADSGRLYDASDVTLADELGRRAGAALENAQLYAQAQEAAKAAEEASRAKDEFLAMVSHELRTPLSAIMGWADLLRDQVTDPALEKPLEVIHRNAHAQVRIIDDVLDVSRVITGKFRIDPRPVDLVAIARDAIEVVRPSALAKQIEIVGPPTTSSHVLVVDPERIQQVVWNLLSNAVKFSDPGGKIEVSIRQEGTSLVLSVSDTGKGIDPAFLPHVFERFRQADSSITRRVGGLGLGLALVRHIVEMHGGQVSAKSAGIDKGATFEISLPIRAVSPSEEASDALPSAPRARAAGILRGVRVLVVDDEPDARELVAAVLSDAGATVETAGSATEGFDRFRIFRPNVLVSDIGMPDEDGYSLMRRIRSLPRAEGGWVPSMALTAFTREEDRSQAIGAGFTTHIGKPVNPEALASAVANLSEIARPS